MALYFLEACILPGSIPFRRYSGRRHDLELPFKRNPLLQVMPAGETIGQEKSALTSSASFTLLRAMSLENFG